MLTRWQPFGDTRAETQRLYDEMNRMFGRHDRQSNGEYGIGDFFRTFTIGQAIDSEKIAAELKDGVLTLHLPKTEKPKTAAN